MGTRHICRVLLASLRSPAARVITSFSWEDGTQHRWASTGLERMRKSSGRLINVEYKLARVFA